MTELFGKLAIPTLFGEAHDDNSYMDDDDEGDDDGGDDDEWVSRDFISNIYTVTF